MKYTYEVNDELNIIIQTDNSGNISFIPSEPANSDYQRYLRWLENPNADEAEHLNGSAPLNP